MCDGFPRSSKHHPKMIKLSNYKSCGAERQEFMGFPQVFPKFIGRERWSGSINGLGRFSLGNHHSKVVLRHQLSDGRQRIRNQPTTSIATHTASLDQCTTPNLGLKSLLSMHFKHLSQIKDSPHMDLESVQERCYGFLVICPLVICYIAIEHGHRNSEFSN